MSAQAAENRPTFRRADNRPTAWAASPGLVAYPDAVEVMEARANAIADGDAEEMVWLLEHPPLYSAGVSAQPGDLVTPGRFPVFSSGRGGRFTYHGPGQRVAYVMLDLRVRRKDVKAFVSALEVWVIAALAEVGIESWLSPGRIGVWTSASGGPEEKIAAIGVRLRRWISLHGISLNVAPNLEHFSGIVPCGIADAGVTSLERLGARTAMAATDLALQAAFERIFGPIRKVDPPL